MSMGKVTRSHAVGTDVKNEMMRKYRSLKKKGIITKIKVHKREAKYEGYSVYDFKVTW
jgi:hypothetical protein